MFSSLQLVLFEESVQDLEEYFERFLETVIARGVTHFVVDSSWLNHVGMRQYPRHWHSVNFVSSVHLPWILQDAAP